MAKKKAKRKTLDTSLPIYELTIALQETEPLIWRRVQTDDCTLDELHSIIQEAMGWCDAHPYAFEVAGNEYANFADGAPEESYDSCQIRLSDLAEQGNSQFLYEYDFGDAWRHTIEMERTMLPEPGIRYPHCVAGEQACPPEDCGGPWGYEAFLDKLLDPEHEEHAEILEWVSEDFDPDVLEIDQVNHRLQELRGWLGRERGQHSTPASFAEGQQVRVKPGVVHREYADIPLGGWTGHIIQVAWLTPVSYEVRWTKATLEQVHSAYGKRCQRDKVDVELYWLDDGDVEATSGDEPLLLEQPTRLVLRPLSEDLVDDRIRMVFGLTSDDALPQATDDTLRLYCEYLRSQLVFPFAADYWTLIDSNPKAFEQVEVLGFADMPLDVDQGLVCNLRNRQQIEQVPLSILRLADENPNYQSVETYTHWFWWCQDEADENQVDDADDDGGDFEDDLDDEMDDEMDDETELPMEFPIGTVALYGPDGKKTTKIAAGVVPHEGAEPIVKRWVASNIMDNPKVQRELEAFFIEYGVSQVAMSDGNLGCPHEEGKDFPVGEDCPFCPWWKGKQGSRASQ